MAQTRYERNTVSFEQAYIVEKWGIKKLQYVFRSTEELCTSKGAQPIKQLSLLECLIQTRTFYTVSSVSLVLPDHNNDGDTTISAMLQEGQLR